MWYCGGRGGPSRFIHRICKHEVMPLLFCFELLALERCRLNSYFDFKKMG